MSESHPSGSPRFDPADKPPPGHTAQERVIDHIMAGPDTPCPPAAEPPRHEISPDERPAPILERVVQGLFGAFIGLAVGVVTFCLTFVSKEAMSLLLFGRNWDRFLARHAHWVLLAHLVVCGLLGAIGIRKLEERANRPPPPRGGPRPIGHPPPGGAASKAMPVLWCRRCKAYRYSEEPWFVARFRHALDVVLVFLTCGVWLPFALLRWGGSLRVPYRCQTCGGRCSEGTGPKQ
jgi:hypothetical protein